MITMNLSGLGATSHSAGLGAISHSAGLGAISHSMGLLGLGESRMTDNLLKLAIGGGLLYAGYRWMQSRKAAAPMQGALGRARRRRRAHRSLAGLGMSRPMRRHSPRHGAVAGLDAGYPMRRHSRRHRALSGLGNPMMYGMMRGMRRRPSKPMRGLGAAMPTVRRAPRRMPYSF